MKKIILGIFCLICGCSFGNIHYYEPADKPNVKNVIIINKRFDEVWKEIVPSLGKTFFVINNLDKDSGLINVSYTGDPEKYVDCGKIESIVKNAWGKRTYSFPASSAYQEYEVASETPPYTIKVVRKMELDGRINIIIESVEPQKTRITVNAKYVIKKDMEEYGNNYHQIY